MNRTRWILRQSLGQTFLRALPAAVLCLGAVASLAAYRFVFPTETSPEEWKPAAEHVREHLEPGDVIRTHPPWNIDALPYLESAGTRLSRQRDPLLEDLYRYDRVWVLSETELADEALRRLPFRTSSARRHRYGDATVWQVPVPDDAAFSWEALERLSDAEVTRLIYKDGERRETRRCENWNEEERRWDCGARDSRLYVGEVFKYVGGDPHRAIWAHPLPDGNRLRITFPKVPLQETLRIRAGTTYLAARRDKGADVRMKVSVDGEVRIRERFPRLETEWEAHEIDTRNRAGEQGRVDIDIWSPDIQDRFFCVNAWVR